jgi:hypothetical protein
MPIQFQEIQPEIIGTYQGRPPLPKPVPPQTPEDMQKSHEEEKKTMEKTHKSEKDEMKKEHDTKMSE